MTLLQGPKDHVLPTLMYTYEASWQIPNLNEICLPSYVEQFNFEQLLWVEFRSENSAVVCYIHNISTGEVEIYK